MTRDEAEQIVFEDFDKITETEMLLLINVIYDDFESRTCESCKHLNDNYCGVVSYFVNAPDMAYVSKEKFSCNKWEQK